MKQGGRKTEAGSLLPTPELHPRDEDLSLGTPGLKKTLGAPSHPRDVDLSLGTPTPFAQNDTLNFYLYFRCKRLANTPNRRKCSGVLPDFEAAPFVD